MKIEKNENLKKLKIEKTKNQKFENPKFSIFEYFQKFRFSKFRFSNFQLFIFSNFHFSNFQFSNLNLLISRKNLNFVQTQSRLESGTRLKSGHKKIQTLDLVWTSTGDGHL